MSKQEFKIDWDKQESMETIKDFVDEKTFSYYKSLVYKPFFTMIELTPDQFLEIIIKKPAQANRYFQKYLRECEGTKGSILTRLRILRAFGSKHGILIPKMKFTIRLSLQNTRRLSKTLKMLFKVCKPSPPSLSLSLMETTF